MTIQPLKQTFCVCKISDPSQIDFSDPFCFVGKTDEELSLVCTPDHVPAQTLAREDGWRGLRITGILDFSLVGILSRLTGALAQAGIGIFAVSTYNTDYLLVRQGEFAHALQVLEQAGYEIGKTAL